MSAFGRESAWRRRSGLLGSAVVVLALAVVGPVLSALSAPAGTKTLLVSRASGPQGKAGNDNSDSAAISGSGRYVAFASKARNLSGADRDNTIDVFVRDMRDARVTLVSRADGPGGAAAENGGHYPDISADGRYVSFVSFSANLPGGTNNASQAYVRDLVTGTTTLASRAPGAAGAAVGSVNAPSLSADGRHLAFSTNTSVVPEDTNTTTDVYVRDLDTDVTELVSRPTDPAGRAVEGSVDPAISGDGRSVTFQSRDHLGTADGEGAGETTNDVFVRDRIAMTTTLVSIPGSIPGSCEPDYPSIASSGRYVVFECNSIFIRDLVAASTSKVSRNIRVSGPGDPAQVSPDGRFVAFVSDSRQDSPLVLGGPKEVFVRDRERGVTVNASRGNGIGLLGDTTSEHPGISDDGRFVVFNSRSVNFSAVDRDPVNDVFRRTLVYEPDEPLPTCDDRAVTQIGTAGRDILRGTPRPDVILALGGNDVINGGASADLICGAAGRDKVNGGRRAASHGDRLFGGPGPDTVIILVGGGSASGGPGDDRIRGSDTNDSGDSLNGGPGRDLIFGLNNASFNDDFIEGGSGPDRVFGGRGPDVIGGGPGNDVLRGGPGDDRIGGGPGRDDVEFGPGER